MCTNFHACEDSSVMSMRKDLHIDMVTHTYARAQLRHTQPKMACTSIALRCHRHQMVLLTQTAVCAAAKGDFTPSRTFPALMLVLLPGRQDPGRGPAENQPRGEMKTHVQSDTLPDSVCHGSPLLLVTVQGRLWTCSRASLVPFDDSVKLDLCNCT